MEANSSEQARTAVLLLGYGEVGQAFAAHLAPKVSHLAIVDPARGGAHSALQVESSPPASLRAFDLVLAAIPSADSLTAARHYAGLDGEGLYIDCSSSARETMRAAAAGFADPTRFVDAAIMGAIAVHGAKTPMLLAGTRAEAAAARLSRLDFVASPLAGGGPGDASAIKLLRSVVTKGLEALAVEGFLAARAMGLLEHVRRNLADIGRSDFSDFLDAIVRTHVVHAPRRAHEVAAALEQVEACGYPATVSRAVLARFEETAREVAHEPLEQVPTTAEAALAWLDGRLR